MVSGAGAPSLFPLPQAEMSSAKPQFLLLGHSRDQGTYVQISTWLLRHKPRGM